MCQCSQIFSIPSPQNWVSRILSAIWYSSTVAAYTSISKTRWSSWKYPRSTQHTDTMSMLSRSLHRRKDILDLQIRSKEKAPPNHREKARAKVGWPRTTCRSCKQRTPWRQRSTWENGVSSIRAPLTTQVSVEPSNHWWPSWRLPI